MRASEREKERETERDRERHSERRVSTPSDGRRGGGAPTPSHQKWKLISVYMVLRIRFTVTRISNIRD